MQIVICPFCASPGVPVRLDKSGRPFFYCGTCGVRVFLYSPLAYGGFLSLAAHVAEVVESVAVADVRREALEYAEQNPIGGMSL